MTWILLSFCTVFAFVLLLPNSLAAVTFLGKILWRVIENRRRARWSDSEVPALLSDLAATFRAGVNLQQGLIHVSASRKWHGVCRDALNEIILSSERGCSMLSVLHSRRFDGRDALAQRLVVCLRVLVVSVSSGGNVVRLLESSAEGARGAVRLRQRARALTAQMRFQAIVVSSAPIFVAFVLEVVSPASLRVFVRDSVGITLAVFMALSNCVGVFVLVRTVRAWEK